MPGSSKTPALKTPAASSETPAPSDPESYSKAEIDSRLEALMSSLSAIQQQASSSSSAAAAPPGPGPVEKFRTVFASTSERLVADHRRSSQIFSAA